MKLLYCPACGSLTELKVGIMKYCTCKGVSGKYCEDMITAVVHEDAIVVGIDNNSFKHWFFRHNFFYCHNRLNDFSALRAIALLARDNNLPIFYSDCQTCFRAISSHGCGRWK